MTPYKVLYIFIQMFSSTCYQNDNTQAHKLKNITKTITAGGGNKMIYDIK